VLDLRSVILTKYVWQLSYQEYTPDSDQSGPSSQEGLLGEVILLVTVVLVVVFHKVDIMDVLMFLEDLYVIFLQILVGVVEHHNSRRIQLTNSNIIIV
jgi:hypothetical protein